MCCWRFCAWTARITTTERNIENTLILYSRSYFMDVKQLGSSKITTTHGCLKEEVFIQSIIKGIMKISKNIENMS